MTAQTDHVFWAGVGYVNIGKPALAPHANQSRTAACDPPVGALDGSEHILSYQNTRSMKFRWVAKEKAWARHGGVRMAFTAVYLSQYGWSYVGPAP